MAPQPANGGIATFARNRREIFNRLLTQARNAEHVHDLSHEQAAELAVKTFEPLATTTVRWVV